MSGQAHGTVGRRVTGKLKLRVQYITEEHERAPEGFGNLPRGASKAAGAAAAAPQEGGGAASRVGSVVEAGGALDRGRLAALHGVNGMLMGVTDEQVRWARQLWKQDAWCVWRCERIWSGSGSSCGSGASRCRALLWRL